jgi:hypothetical protein
LSQAHCRGRRHWLSWENARPCRRPHRRQLPFRILRAVPVLPHNLCRPPICTPCSTWPSRPPAPLAPSSTAPRSTSSPCASRKSRSTTSSPKSTTPAKQAIIETLLTAYPGHGILAEESGSEHGAKDSEFVWIIDPLDGTTNFIHGFPVYCVSIALAVKGKIEQAVIYDPTRNDLFTATKGRGAYLNDRRIRVSKRTQLQEMPDLHRLPVPPGRQLPQLPGHDGRRDAAHRRPAPPRRRRTGPGLCGRRFHRRLF